jgi:hypothetical protein
VKIGRKGEVRQGYASVVIVHPAKGTAEAGAEPAAPTAPSEPVDS